MSRTQKRYISHSCSEMKLTVLYSHWSRWKDFAKLSSFFRMLYNTLNFILLFRRFNSSIIQLILPVVDYFWVFQCFRQCFCFFFSKAYIYFGFLNVSDNVSVSSLVSFACTFSFNHSSCNFSSVAAAVAGSCQKYGGANGCFAFACRGNENCLFSSCGMTLYISK